MGQIRTDRLWHCDGEVQDEDDEDNGDREPSLGAPEADEDLRKSSGLAAALRSFEHDPAESGIGDDGGLMEQMGGPQ